jgi:hypothetical protein
MSHSCCRRKTTAVVEFVTVVDSDSVERDRLVLRHSPQFIIKRDVFDDEENYRCRNTGESRLT